MKAYAPRARRDFIKAVTDQAAVYGLTKKGIEPVVAQGDVGLIGGEPFPREVVEKRKRLVERIEREGFEQVMEAMAYTWFNRFVAIRFMEVHGYLDHGYRVLSTTPVEHPHVPSPGATGQAKRDPSEIRYAETSSISRGKPGSTGRANSTNSTNEKNAGLPEIVGYAEHVDLPGVDRERVVELKLAGNQDEELYRMLLVGQCNALHKAMPFLFERIGDATELLLPENLLHSDSLIRRMVNEVPEEEWQDVEIIGWLYQFYISEKKDQVIGKVVKSEDIPAATQLFTPNWIVKYMVQNTLGRQWLATYPESLIKNRMEYYIEPAEQTPEVEAQLKAITPQSLNPEEMTLLDPACGSGHILVEAYDLFKAIYQERGYRAKDIPRLILEKNLYGLDIDDRAAQLAAFALMMKAREDDGRIFENGTCPHVLAMQETNGMDAEKITESINTPIVKGDLPPPETLFQEMDEARTPLFSRENLSVKGEISQGDVDQLIQLFEHSKTLGSLIRVPEDLHEKLVDIAERVEDVLEYGEMFGKAAAGELRPIVGQAGILLSKYMSVVSNPPYMGSHGMNPLLKSYARKGYGSERSDLYAMFIRRMTELATTHGQVGIMTPFTWMFLSSYESLRTWLLKEKAILSLIHPEYHSFFESAYVPICTFVLANSQISPKADFIRLCDFYGEEIQQQKALEAVRNSGCGWRYTVRTTDFTKIPGTPLVYWIGKNTLDVFNQSALISYVADAKQGLATANNARFLRRWFEVDFNRIGFNIGNRRDAMISAKKWFPYNKGGEFRRWYGNNEFVVNWENDGKEIKEFKPHAVIRNPDYYFREAISWSDVTASSNAFRHYDEGFIFDACAHSAFIADQSIRLHLLSYLNSSLVCELAKLLNPTMHFHVGYFNKLPLPAGLKDLPVNLIAKKALELSRRDWDLREVSWGFRKHPLLRNSLGSALPSSFDDWEHNANAAREVMKQLEEENNRQFIDFYHLNDDVSPSVTEEEIMLFRPDREEDIRTLISYTIGCMMGRYSLDVPGLIYAHSGNAQFWEIYHDKHNQLHPSQDHSFNSTDSPAPLNRVYPVQFVHDSKAHFTGVPSEGLHLGWLTFPPDADGIIPITDMDWFPDDAANRFFHFISVVWPEEHLEENLAFVSESLGPKRGESPRETIRRYMATGFFKHHLRLYKKRPIYWLFTSGKLRAFQCLVYLHRYNEGTLSRMRTEYVIPLQGKFAARIEQLSGDMDAATSTAHRKKLERERDKLVKQKAELQAFDEKLRHYADMRIALDLDDGVKVNYGKFEDLLAEVNAITGKK